MNIAMFTNLYLPLVGGIQRSIATFKAEFEQRGHRVLVVTPALRNQSLDDPTVVEVPALQEFNGSDFSVALPIPGYLADTLDEFAPDLVHSHHPFLLGDTAVRAATKRNAPLVFTYHTMWEHYLHYAPDDSPTMQAFVKRMAAEYCELCDHIIAPCASIADILRERGVTSPISAIPTGIDAERFAQGDGSAARERLDIPRDAFVAGYIGRLGPEKNLGFLAHALSEFARDQDNVHLLIVGDGEAAQEVEQIAADAGLADRLHMPGVLEDQDLVDAYHALDAFAFSSKSETQGLVLAEAMAASRPVVALDAPGARDVVEDGENGRLLPEEDPAAFAAALAELYQAGADARARLQDRAHDTAQSLTSGRCAARLLEVYEQLLGEQAKQRSVDESPWNRSLRRLAAEWHLWSGRAAAAGEAVSPTEDIEKQDA